MFRVLIRRLAPFFAVIFALLAHAPIASAQNIDPMSQRIRIEERTEAKVSIKRRVYAKRHYRSHRHASARKAYRRAYAKSQRRHEAARRLHAGLNHKAATQQRAREDVSTRHSGNVVAKVDVSAQRMTVSVGGEVVAVWQVSTARAGYRTPRGSYGPKRMHVSYFSKKYYNSPMPYSIFFTGGYAVHGTGAIKALGRPASHGCIRLATGNARTLYNLIRANGVGRSRIIIS